MEDCQAIQRIHEDEEDAWAHIGSCRSWIGRRLERGFLIRVAQWDGQVVGHAEWIVDDGVEGRFLYLGMLHIHADFQRKGLGRAMLADGEHLAREAGCARLVTMPETENTSIVFYQKYGFLKGRSVWACELPTAPVANKPLPGTATEGVPEDAASAMPFAFGHAQVSSRHMWEVCNYPPGWDERETAALRLEDGRFVQISYFSPNTTGIALGWGALDDALIQAALSLGAAHGLNSLAFYFYEDQRHHFPSARPIDEIEIFKPLI